MSLPSPACLAATSRYHGINYAGDALAGVAAFFSLSLVVTTVSFALFILHKNDSIILRRRSTSLVFVSILGSLFQLLHTAGRDLIGPSNFPCSLFFFLTYMTVPLIATPLVLRLHLYRNALLRAQTANRLPLLSARLTAKPSRPLSSKPSASRSNHQSLSSVSDSEDSKPPAHASNLSPRSFRARYWGQSLAAYLRTALGGHFRKSGHARPAADNELHQLSATFMDSGGYMFFWLGMSIVPCVLGMTVRLAASPAVREGCTGCEMELGDVLFFIFWVALIAVVGLAVALPLLRSQNDPLQLLKEFVLAWLVGGTCGLLGLGLWLIDPQDLYVSRIFNWQWIGAFGTTMMVACQTVLVVGLSKWNTQEQIKSPYFNARERLVQGVLSGDKALKAKFRAHLQRELGEESLLFIDAVDDWALHFAEEGRQLKARTIFDSFVARRALLEINISSRNRELLTSRFLRGNVAVDVFDPARAEVVEMMLTDTFPRFLNQLEAESGHSAPAIVAVHAVDAMA